jgi:hypothetical protein
MDDSCWLSFRHCDIVHSEHFDLLLGAIGGVTGVLICHSARNGQRKSQNTVQIKPKHVALITIFTKLVLLDGNTYVNIDVTAERGAEHLKVSQLVKVASSTNKYIYGIKYCNALRTCILNKQCLYMNIIPEINDVIIKGLLCLTIIYTPLVVSQHSALDMVKYR